MWKRTGCLLYLGLLKRASVPVQQLAGSTAGGCRIGICIHNNRVYVCSPRADESSPLSSSSLLCNLY
jgi:hypothetical protein